MDTGTQAGMQAPHLCLAPAALAQREEVVAHRRGHLACEVHRVRPGADSTP